jgi:hypothetical protein
MNVQAKIKVTAWGDALLSVTNIRIQESLANHVESHEGLYVIASKYYYFCHVQVLINEQ